MVNTNDERTVELVMAMRDRGRSWTEISDRTGVPVPALKALTDDSRRERRRRAAGTTPRPRPKPEPAAVIPVPYRYPSDARHLAIYEERVAGVPTDRSVIVQPGGPYGLEAIPHRRNHARLGLRPASLPIRQLVRVVTATTSVRRRARLNRRRLRKTDTTQGE